MKVGNRVTVLPNVSNCKDAGSVQVNGPDGIDRARFVGKRGEVVQMGKDGPCTCPNEAMVLVDSQMVNGKQQGPVEMREWFLESELEVG